MALCLAIFAVVGVLSGCAAPLIVAGAATGGAVAVDPRAAGAVLDDEVIEIKAIELLSRDPQLWEKGHFNVTSYNYSVLLSGETPTSQWRDQAAQTVASVPNVRRVFNELTVREPTSMSVRSNDTFLTGRIRTALLSEDGVSSSRIKVVTENSVVYLMGLVSRKMADQAVNAVRHIKGVARVVTLFELR